jgi:hypothetical protein
MTGAAPDGLRRNSGAWGGLIRECGGLLFDGFEGQGFEAVDKEDHRYKSPKNTKSPFQAGSHCRLSQPVHREGHQGVTRGDEEPTVATFFPRGMSARSDVPQAQEHDRCDSNSLAEHQISRLFIPALILTIVLHLLPGQTTDCVIARSNN